MIEDQRSLPDPISAGNRSRGRRTLRQALCATLVSLGLGGLAGCAEPTQYPEPEYPETYFQPLIPAELPEMVRDGAVVVILNPGGEITVLADPSLKPRTLKPSEILVPRAPFNRGATRVTLVFNVGSGTAQNCWTHFGQRKCAGVTVQ